MLLLRPLIFISHILDSSILTVFPGETRQLDKYGTFEALEVCFRK